MRRIREFPLNDLVKKSNRTKKKFTRLLGNKGRVILKEKKREFEKEIEKIRNELEKYKKELGEELNAKLKKSKQQILDHFVPMLKANPPYEMTSCLPISYKEKDIKLWVKREIFGTLPKADELCQKMKLEVVYKDITFETLNDKDFISKIKKEFPYHDWDEKLYAESLAAEEKEASKSREI